MIRIEIDGPYKRARIPVAQRVLKCIGFVALLSCALLVAWIALLWMLDIYLGTTEFPLNTVTQSHV